MINEKKAAMEMSVGTIVTIVLLMSVLILGLILIRNIFSGAVDNIDGINQEVQSQIGKMFEQEDSRKVAVYPTSRLIKIKKGNKDYLGFAFSIRNTQATDGKFDYTVSVNDNDIRDKCGGLTAQGAEKWIAAGGSGSITLEPGSKMDQPEFVRFLIPDDAPPCLIRFGIDVKKDGLAYGQTVSVDVKLEAA